MSLARSSLSEKNPCVDYLLLANSARSQANFDEALYYLGLVITMAQDAALLSRAYKLRAKMHADAAFADMSLAIQHDAEDEALFDACHHYLLSQTPLCLSRETQTLHYLSVADWTYVFDMEVGRITAVNNSDTEYVLSDIFCEDKEKGAFLFKNAKKDPFVVKLRKEETDTNYLFLDDVLMTKRAYPTADLTQYAVHVYCVPWDLKAPYLILMRMPFHPGLCLSEMLPKLGDRVRQGELILAVLVELQRIHGLKVLHGDIHDRNIIIQAVATSSAFHVRFIDFESAYCIDDACVNGTTTIWVKSESPYWDKERMGPDYVTVKPHYGQDMYSLGKMLVAYQHLAFYTPQLNMLVQAAMDDNVLNRPTLNAFIRAVKKDLAEMKAENHSPQPSSTHRQLIERLKPEFKSLCVSTENTLVVNTKAIAPLSPKKSKEKRLVLPPIPSVTTASATPAKKGVY